MSYRSTALAPVRSSGATRPICQSHRIGWPVLSRCGGAQHVPWHATGAGRGTTRQPNRRVVVPAEFDARTTIRWEPRPSRPVATTLARHASPGTAVDAVAEPRTAVGGVVVRRRDCEPLAGGPRARRRQAVHERRRRRARARVGRDRGSREHVAAGAEHPEGEGRRIGLDHLRRGLNQLSACGRCRDGQRCIAPRQTASPCATAGPAAPAGRGARAPLVGHLEAQQPVARWEMPGVPTQTLDARRTLPSRRCAGDPARARRRPAGRIAWRTWAAPHRSRAAGCGAAPARDGDGRPCSGAAQRSPDPLRKCRGRARRSSRRPSPRSPPARGWPTRWGREGRRGRTCSRSPSSAARTVSSHTFR